MEQLPLIAIEPPARLIVPEPGVAVAIPPQVEVRPLGVATTSPAGSASVNATPVSAAKLFGFVIEKLTVVVPPGRNLLGTKLLLMDGGNSTAIEAVAPSPSRDSFELRPLTVLV